MDENQVIKNPKLQALVLKWLGSEDLKGVSDWYSECVDAQVQYVVFVVRRCYVLALILEELTQKTMEDGKNKSYVTDAAFLSCCEDIAAYYREHCAFPKIMLCDDLLIHGRNLNRVIENVENRLYKLLPEIDRQTIRDALSAAIQIRVYCFAINKRLLLRTDYMQDATYKVKYEPVKWHELSSHLSSLIVESGIANASYINSEIISRKECERIVYSADNGFKKRIFQNVSGYIKVDFLKNDSGLVFAIYTIRLIKNRLNNNYRVMPLVFMPNLDDTETKLLYESIRDVGLKIGYTTEFFDKLDYLYHIDGKRMFNEWVTLIISQAILNEFNIKHQVECDDEDYTREICKLARNYRFDSSKKHETYLTQCVENAIFSNIEELSEVLLKCNYNRPIFTLGDKLVSKQQMRKLFEDYFYVQGYQEEFDAVQYNGEPDMQRSVSRRMVRGCCFLYKELLDQVASETACFGISCFLFMMDSGVLAISSHAARDTKVVGFAQFAKAGEQSLLILPLRYIEYIPFLSIAQEWCRQFYQDYIEHLRAFMGTEFCDIPRDIMEKLIGFIEKIEKIEERVSDWNGAYYEKIRFASEVNESDSKEFIQEQYDFEQRKNRHVENYKKYMMVMTQKA